jgi:hypothetical protein
LFVFVLRAGKAQLKSAYKELFSIITMTSTNLFQKETYQ